MKKSLFAFMVIALLCGSQSIHAQKIAFGVKAGVNLTSMNFDNSQFSSNPKLGYQVGFFFRATLHKIGFQPEVLICRHKVLKKTFGEDIEESFTYLNVPVMLKYYPIARLNIQMGPQFGFLLDGERKTNSTALNVFDKNIKDVYKSSDVSVSVGLGYDFKFGLELDFRYNVGIKDINNVADGGSIQSRAFMMSLGWAFLKK
jgi:Outer membrane protein beta-barrel domain